MQTNIFKSKKDFTEQYLELCQSSLGKDFSELTDQERYYVLASLIASKARVMEHQTHEKGEKKVYYFSLEFLIGPLLENYLLNFGVRDIVEESLEDLGSSLEELAREEADPGLGNGGLGRLAACFMDSMAEVGL